MGWDLAPGSASEATILLDLDMQGQCTSHLGFSSGSSVIILWQSGRGANWDEPCGKVPELEEWVLFVGHAACWIGSECEYWKIWTDFCLGAVIARCGSQAKMLLLKKSHVRQKSHDIYMSWPRGSPLGPSLPAARCVTHPEFQKDLMEASGEPGQDAVPLLDLGVRYLFGYTPEV